MNSIDLKYVAGQWLVSFVAQPASITWMSPGVSQHSLRFELWWLLFLGWNELLIASFSHRSVAVSDGILLATGLHVHR